MVRYCKKVLPLTEPVYVLYPDINTYTEKGKPDNIFCYPCRKGKPCLFVPYSKINNRVDKEEQNNADKVEDGFVNKPEFSSDQSRI